MTLLVGFRTMRFPAQLLGVYDDDKDSACISSDASFTFPDRASNAHALHRAAIVAAANRFPALLRRWWDSRGSSSARGARKRAVVFEKYISNHVSRRCIRSEFRQIARAARAKLWDTEQMHIRGNDVSRTIAASYKTEECVLEIHLELPSNYPLSLPRIDCSRRFGVEEDRRRRWMIQIRSIISGQNGSLLDAILQWKQNLDHEFSGTDPCPICFSVIHASRRTLPRLRCGTCGVRFHSHCLYKWLSSSQKSTCPMCRQPF